MKLKVQKRLSSDVLDCSPKRVVFDESSLSEIKEAITKDDIRGLVQQGVIRKTPKYSTSRVRARQRHVQKTKGRRRGIGKRKGTAKARTPEKRAWINKIRLQRAVLKQLKEKALIAKNIYRDLYLKAKGGFFRSRRHLKTYMDENKLFKKND